MHYKKPPRGWFCEDHKTEFGIEPPVSKETLVPTDVHLLPEDSLLLDFFPYSILPKDIPKHASKQTPSSLLANLKVFNFITASNNSLLISFNG